MKIFLYQQKQSVSPQQNCTKEILIMKSRQKENDHSWKARDARRNEEKRKWNMSMLT